MDEQLTFEFAERPTIKGFPELRWTGKRPYRSTQYYPAQLRERYGEEKDGWINKIFWGDNLQVMSHMLKEYRGKIDLIYIDPPFDSKADYKKKIEIKGVGKAETDSTSFEEKQYGDIWTNDEYLQFMYERIILLRELMSSSGNIFVHCDWHKSSYLRIICDEVFGNNNFVNEIIWKRKGGSSNPSKQLDVATDTILWYRKTESAIFNAQFSKDSPETQQYIEERFNNVDENGRRFMKSPIVSPNYRENLIYEYKGYTPPANGWSISRELMEKWDADSKLYFPERGNRIYRKIFLDEYPGQPVSNIWTDIFVINPMALERLDYPTLRNTINMLAEATSIVACYNYTGTPYVKRQVLPEVVYAYGLRDSISHGFLKDADPIGFDNVKNEEFLKKSITMFWERYGGKTYEGLPPKMAIFAASVAEATDVVRPAVEKVLSELNVSLDTILVNTGDTTVTKNDDIRDFNNLDVFGTEGSRKQFIILVEKGREGWNCRSLLGIALFRSPKSKIFVLQATMRCLRKLTDEQLKATVFLSKENLYTLDEELRNNYNMEIKDLGQSSDKKKSSYKVRVLPPPRSIKMKRIWHEYSLIEKEYSEPIDFKIAEIDETKYESKMYEKGSIRLELSTKETVIDDIKEQMRYSRFSLVGEISRYMNLPCVLINRILSESTDGFDSLVDAVNKHNEVLDDVIIPKIFHSLYEVKSEQKNKDVDVILLKEPKDAGYYEFSADENLVIEKDHNGFTPEEIKKSFHADTYCFDSKPEKECFLQYISSKKVKEIYFTGMFTANQGDLFVQYYDPESKRIRQYYPDFLAKMADGSYQLIEVKGDNMIDDEVVKAKAEAAEEMSVASGMKYVMYAGSVLMKQNVLEHPPMTYSGEQPPLLMVAEDSVPYGK